MKLARSVISAALSISVVSGITIPYVPEKDIPDGLPKGYGPLKFAHANVGPYSPGVHGDWNPDKNTWTLKVDSPGAVSLNFGFDKFEIPENASLSIENNSDNFNAATITVGSEQNSNSDQYWSPIIETDSVTISLTYSCSERIENPSEHLKIGSINVGFRSIGKIINNLSGVCNVDVMCPIGDEWDSEIRAVGGYSFGGNLFCTGAMINNMKKDGTPYFLTAYHCGVTRDKAASLVVYWNFKTSRCTGTPDGELYDTSSGAEFLAGDENTDVTLLKLKKAPNRAHKVTFAGWDNSPEAFEVKPGVCIHHPLGNEKRISFEYDAMLIPIPTSYNSDNPFANANHIKVIDWDVGTTEPGSSGSPLFNGDHRIIGQLHGGRASCADSEPDWFGRFHTSYRNSNLSQWLDPNNDLNGDYGGIDTYDPYAVPTISPSPPVDTAQCDNDKNTLMIDILPDNYHNEISWKLTDSSGSIVGEANEIFNFMTSALYSKMLCLENDCYTFTLNDSYGDGICCNFGSGSYSLTYNGIKLVEDEGEFGFSDSSMFGSDDGKTFDISDEGGINSKGKSCLWITSNTEYSVSDICNYDGPNTSPTDCTCTCASINVL